MLAPPAVGMLLPSQITSPAGVVTRAALSAPWLRTTPCTAPGIGLVSANQSTSGEQLTISSSSAAPWYTHPLQSGSRAHSRQHSSQLGTDAPCGWLRVGSCAPAASVVFICGGALAPGQPAAASAGPGVGT